MTHLGKVLSIVLLLTATASAANFTTSTDVVTPTDAAGGVNVIALGADDVTVSVINDGVTNLGSIYNVTSLVRIGNSTGAGTCSLILDGGSVAAADQRANWYVAEGSAGTLDVRTGGGAYAFNYYMGMGQTAVPGASTTLVSGGTLDIMYNFFMGYRNNTSATYNQTGGTVLVGGDTYIGGYVSAAVSSASMTISGGSFSAKTVSVGTATSAGTLSVIGSAASISTTTGAFRTYGTSQSTLEFTLDDSAGHISCINAAVTALTLGAVVDIDLDGFTPTEGQIFDLITDGEGVIDISAMVLASEDAALWTLMTNDAGDTLQAGYMVPEPATMALLGLGMVSLVLRRRSAKA